MVVVAGVPSGAFATADRRADFAFEHLGAPDAMAILAKRAKIAIHPSRMPALLTLLSRSDVRETLDADASPAFAARMARAITDALNEHKDIEQTVRALRSPAAQVQAWFDRYDGEAEADYRQLVLPIAVSVLEDSSYLTVTDAAVALYRRLFPEEEGPPPLRFRRSLREQQQWIQLTSSREYLRPGMRSSPVPQPAAQVRSPAAHMDTAGRHQARAEHLAGRTGGAPGRRRARPDGGIGWPARHA